MQLEYTSLAALLDAAEQAGKPLSELVLAQQAEELEQDPRQVYDRMARCYQVMADGVEPGCDPALRSTSGLTGGNAAKMKAAVQAGRTLTGPVLGGALTRALAISELNAAMGRIVAAPTAGSCGILPAALLTMEQEKSCARHACVMALFTASAVGLVIAKNACLAGAQGGCQAECGSAAAMAAAAIVELAGGSPKMVGDAVAIALKNVLGLVCDPVAGLVEVPCVKRNAAGVAGAFVAAELALAGIGSVIPPDEAILAMKRVGDAMSPALKETALGGLAATPTACRLRDQLLGRDAWQ
ncbi:L-serine ammonia-lyase, iron-sulfur-dependent, subunit alpha [uncultured Gemmiger sp.]|uniref:L-serine ammonia-lyase, iron-sulfur-dependent, subunit alpha n=1 Tax=uncultured Gemmiger sp. TaxID=1623490 RepID=UPI0025D6F33A|nr:L-serine ammonia-lyase, iron-sulfur-dependent, subunit alpha [uncultured Gemmiger sp.]